MFFFYFAKLLDKTNTMKQCNQHNHRAVIWYTGSIYYVILGMSVPPIFLKNSQKEKAQELSRSLCIPDKGYSASSLSPESPNYFYFLTVFYKCFVFVPFDFNFCGSKGETQHRLNYSEGTFTSRNILPSQLSPFHFKSLSVNR